MAPLKWWPAGGGEWSAWSTTDGVFVPLTFAISRTHLGWRLVARDTRTFNASVVVGFDHVGFALEDVQRFADTILATLPIPAGEPALSAEELGAQFQQRHQSSERCEFRHAFPLGATEGTWCACGRVTRGSLRRRAS